MWLNRWEIGQGNLEFLKEDLEVEGIQKIKQYILLTSCRNTLGGELSPPFSTFFHQIIFLAQYLDSELIPYIYF